MDRRFWIWVLSAATVALGLRVVLMHGQSIWVDEAFSLAMATGHSLEHPADLADPARGDFVQTADAHPPGHWRSYLQHDARPAGMSRVLRAVYLSDTSPPMYYVLLSGWTRTAGTSDTALRGFSIFCSLLSLFFVGRIALRVGGRGALGPALILAVCNPFWSYYATEGRMYTLLLLLILAAADLTLSLDALPGWVARWRRLLLWSGWVLVAAAGMLTHYFYAFPLAGMWVWLVARGSRRSRWEAVVGCMAVGLLILPWYRYVPEALAAWRVTAGWLEWRPDGYSPPWVPWRLFWAYFSAMGEWGASWMADLVASLGLLLLGAGLFWTWRRRAVDGRRAVLWLWLVASVTGPLVFDLWRGTYTGAVMRYGIGGLPAALLLASLGVVRLPRWGRAALLGVLLLAWFMPLRTMHHNHARSNEPYARVASYIDRNAGPDTVVVMHSIPSGVTSLARYMASDTPIYAWVGQLGERRVPGDAAALIERYPHVIFVDLHAVGAEPVEEAYYRAHAGVVVEAKRGTARIVEFRRR